jgi:SAM-dependent methyltransferase
VASMTHGHGDRHGHGHGLMSAEDLEAAEPPVLDAAFWDARYGEADAIWSGDPNPQLVAEAADLAPGVALDVGCGEGADAIWLAQRGWEVTATDLSGVALARAAAHADAAGVADRIAFQHVDVTQWAPPEGAFDLVTAQFMHLPSQQRVELHRRLAAAVAVGGSLLLVGHHPSDLDGEIPRPRSRDWFFTAADVAAVLDPQEWTVVVADERARQAPHPESGEAVTIHDAVLMARRTSARTGP